MKYTIILVDVKIEEQTIINNYGIINSLDMAKDKLDEITNLELNNLNDIEPYNIEKDDETLSIYFTESYFKIYKIQELKRN